MFCLTSKTVSFLIEIVKVLKKQYVHPLVLLNLHPLGKRKKKNDSDDERPPMRKLSRHVGSYFYLVHWMEKQGNANSLVRESLLAAKIKNSKLKKNSNLHAYKKTILHGFTGCMFAVNLSPSQNSINSPQKMESQHLALA